jgi:hypothetical protein
LKRDEGWKRKGKGVKFIKKKKNKKLTRNTTITITENGMVSLFPKFAAY